MKGTLILLRHGQSEWNAQNRFTGWVNVALTERGLKEARDAGRTLATNGLFPDYAHTSVLKRAITTTNIALEETGCHWIPVTRTWRLNERHYGALAGLDKTETVEKYGAAQVHVWRRSYSVRPPMLEDTSEFRNDRRYASLTDTEIPRSESLADVQARLMPYWYQNIAGQLEAGKTVLLGAHGNSLRALVKEIEKMGDEEVADLEIATGTPRIYTTTFDGNKLTFSQATVLPIQ